MSCNLTITTAAYLDGPADNINYHHERCSTYARGHCYLHTGRALFRDMEVRCVSFAKARQINCAGSQ